MLPIDPRLGVWSAPSDDVLPAAVAVGPEPLCPDALCPDALCPDVL